MSRSLLRSAVGLIVGTLAAVGLMAYGITEEVPLGSLEGETRMSTSGIALPEAQVILVPQGSVQGRVRRFETDENGKFRFRNLAAGRYTIEASGKAHSFEPQTIDVREGKPTTLRLDLKPQEPRLSLYASQKTFTPDEDPQIQLQGFAPEKELALEVYRIDIDRVLARGGIFRLFSAFSRYEYDRETDPRKEFSNVQKLTMPVQNRDIEGVFLMTPSLPKLNEGLYWIDCRIGKLRQGTYLNITRIGLVTKTSGRNILAYVADMKTGQAVPGAQVALASGTKLLSPVKTAEDGTAQLPIVRPDGQTGPGVLVAQQGDSYAVVDFGLQDAPPNSEKRMFLYPERPVYRPGDTVRYKGILRQLVGTEYRMIGGGRARVELRQEDGTVVARQDVTVSSKGTFHGTFDTSSEAEPGLWEIGATVGDAQGSTSVGIASYRKPEFTVTIVPEKPRVTYGERVRATVKCEYYFGGPVIGARVNGWVSRGVLYKYEYDDGVTESYGDGAGEDYQEFELVTNDKGEAVVEFKADIDPKAMPLDYRYEISASVTESGEKYVDGTGAVEVTQGDYQLEVLPEAYFTPPGQTVPVVIDVKEHDSRKPIANRVVKVTLGRERWEDRATVFEPEQTLSATTDGSGRAVVSVAPRRSGTYTVRAEVVDDRRNAVRAENGIWVSGEAYQGAPRSDSFSLVLEKRTYKIGDTCRAVIRTGRPGFDALVTVEADEVLWSRVVRLESDSTVVEIPVTKEFSPNVNVSVAAIHDQEFLEFQRRLVVADERKQLRVEVKPDRDRLLPGETVNFDIRTADASGTPMPAEVSLAVVDESIYAIRPDTTSIDEAFYPMRYPTVATNHSFPELYLGGGDKSGGRIAVRKNFKDTAFWAPQVQTDPQGRARVTVKLPDNLTSWRATAIGISDDTRVGRGTGNVKVSKPVMVRLQTPMFLSTGDEVTVSAVVLNDSGRDADATVWFESQGVQVQGEARQRIRLGRDRSSTLQWTIKAPESGDARLVAKVQLDGGANDGVEQRLTVLPSGLRDVDRRAGEVRGTGVETFTIASDSDPRWGGVSLTLSPTIGDVLFGSLEDLIGFPYGCVEQTMSRFLPAVVVQQGLRGRASPNPELTAQIPAIVRDGLARLVRMQQGDGAWGWWEYGDADAFMTAYVLEGLWQAKQAGYTVPDRMVTRGREWATKLLSKPLPERNNRIQDLSASDRRDRYALALAVARWGDVDVARSVLRPLPPTDASAVSLAYAARLAKAVGDEPVHAQLLDRLRARAEGGAGIAYFRAGRFEYGVEPTALALLAFVEADATDPMVAPLVRYLMQQRKGNSWVSTRDSAFALMALTTYLERSGERPTPQTVTVVLNGRTVGTYTMDPNRPRDARPVVRVARNQLSTGTNRLEVRSSAGVTYYGLEVRQAVARSTRQPTPGLEMTRRFYRLESRKIEDGSARLMPAAQPTDGFDSGDFLQCQITIRSDRPREFVMVEVPIPANTRVTEREDLDVEETWSYWWSRIVVRDDRVALFARSLPQGTSTLTFNIRAESRGTTTLLPATLENMYDPGQWTAAEARRVEVRR